MATNNIPKWVDCSTCTAALCATCAVCCPDSPYVNHEQVKLKQAKKVLSAAGLTSRDYNHLTYEEILKLAGVE